MEPPICRIRRVAALVVAAIGILSAFQSEAQYTATPSKQLDSLLQDYAYRAFRNPRTGTVYDAAPPSNLTGVEIAAVRLRRGSLRVRGVESYKEFHIPPGVIVQPYVERLALVYHNLGNWSSVYYPLPGYTYLAPVLGLLAYNAVNLSGTDLNELDVVASSSPILIKFADVREVPAGLSATCVWFDLDGLPEFQDPVSEDVCSTYRQGHFSIVVNSTGLAPAPSPGPGPGPSRGGGGGKRHKAKVWRIVAGCVGGFAGLVLLALLVVCLWRYGESEKVAEMERRAEAGESLQMARVGATQAPVASGTRTQPVLENEYVV